MLKRPATSDSQTLNMVDAEILDGGILNGPQTATAPPAYRGEVDLYEVETIDLNQLVNVPGNPMAMSFSMDDAILPPENLQHSNKCYSYPIDITSLSSTSKNVAGPPAKEVSADQPYLANPRIENQKQKGYYDYV